MWIENVAADDIPHRFHHDCGDNSMLIQIRDHNCTWWPEPKHNFKERHFFVFDDIENGDHDSETKGITDEQAKQLVELLKHAKQNCMNVVVHCFAGICRSGAVVEIGTMMGFNDVGKFRQPNVRVKGKMMKVLGWSYDSTEDERRQSEFHIANHILQRIYDQEAARVDKPLIITKGV